MVVGAEQSGGDRRPQRRLHAAHLRAAEPTGREAAAPLEIMAEPQPLDLVAAERHHQRAALAKIDVDARIAPRARGRSCGHMRWLSSASASSSGSPGSCSAAAASMPVAARLAPAPTAARSNTATESPRCGEPPGDRQPDHAGADHRDIDRRREPLPAGSRPRRRRERAHGGRRQAPMPSDAFRALRRCGRISL